MIQKTTDLADASPLARVPTHPTATARTPRSPWDGTSLKGRAPSSTSATGIRKHAFGAGGIFRLACAWGSGTASVSKARGVGGAAERVREFGARWRDRWAGARALERWLARAQRAFLREDYSLHRRQTGKQPSTSLDATAAVLTRFRTRLHCSWNSESNVWRQAPFGIERVPTVLRLDPARDNGDHPDDNVLKEGRVSAQQNHPLRCEQLELGC